MTASTRMTAANVAMLDPASSIATGAFPFLDARGRLFVTAIVKTTFQLHASGLATLAPAVPLWDDATGESSAETSLVTASDWAPRKALADVIVVGSARPPRSDATRALVGFALARGPEVLLRKRLVGLGDGVRARDRAAPLDGTPIAWENTWGGPTCDENPVGVGLSPGDTQRPVWFDPDAPRSPASFSAVSPSFRGRSVYLPKADAEALARSPAALSDELDLRFFQVAPRDQRTRFLRGGEQILLVGLHPSHPVFIARLPALVAYARLVTAAPRPRPVPLVGDTLWIDAERGIATVTSRGCLLVSPAASAEACFRDRASWAVEAGLAPCADVEETVGSPRGWSQKVSSVPVSKGIVATSPTVSPVSIEDASGFAAASFAWSLSPGKTRRVVVVKASFDLDPKGGEPSLSAVQVSPGGDEHAGEGHSAELLRASDFAAWKAKTDVILRGTAYAPDGAAATVVALSLGSLRARVVVSGPRTWDRTGVPSAPGAFVPLPLCWEHAFGGPGYAANPAGAGFLQGSLPPRIEDPERLVRSRGDRPPPAGLGPVSPAWEERASLLGRYDAAWQRERWPYFPADFDPAFFQAAPPSRQIAEPRGGEAFRIDSVRPGGAGLSGVLPSLRPRAFVARSVGDPFEVLLSLDTITFDTDEARLFLVFRGSFEPEVSRREPLRVLLFREDARAPLTSEDVAARVVGRSEPRLLADTKTEEALSPLAPDSADEPCFRLAFALEEVTSRAPRGLFAERAAALGGRPPAPPRPLSRAAVETLVREGKPLLKCDLSDADLTGIDLSGRDLTGAILTRAKLDGARFDKACLVGVSLAFVRASKSSWEEADLTRTDWEGASLSEARFDRAQLGRASFAKATLENARLDGADAAGASFAAANLRGLSAEKTRREKADFTGATLDFARFRDAQLSDAKLIAVRGEEACFDEAILSDARFEKSDLARSTFVRAEAKSAVWECCDLEGASFEGAVLEAAIVSGSRLVSATLVRAKARQASFREADLTSARLDGADLMRASFEGANLRKASLRNTSLFEADLRGAAIEGADFSGALREERGKGAT